MQVRFTIPGRVSGKGRPRVAVRFGHAVAYTPEKTRSAEAMVRTIAADAMAGRPLFTGPVDVKIHIVVEPPASWSRKKREAAKYLVGRPDVDNQIKLLNDSCNGIIFKDDAQICDLTISRRYALTGGERVVVTITDAAECEAESLFAQGRAA